MTDSFTCSAFSTPSEVCLAIMVASAPTWRPTWRVLVRYTRDTFDSLFSTGYRNGPQAAVGAHPVAQGAQEVSGDHVDDSIWKRARRFIRTSNISPLNLDEKGLSNMDSESSHTTMLRSQFPAASTPVVSRLSAHQEETTGEKVGNTDRSNSAPEARRIDRRASDRRNSNARLSGISLSRSLNFDRSTGGYWDGRMSRASRSEIEAGVSPHLERSLSGGIRVDHEIRIESERSPTPNGTDS